MRGRAVRVPLLIPDGYRVIQDRQKTPCTISGGFGCSPVSVFSSDILQKGRSLYIYLV